MAIRELASFGCVENGPRLRVRRARAPPRPAPSTGESRRPPHATLSPPGHAPSRPPAPQGWLAGTHRPSGRRGSRVARRAPRPPARGEGTPARVHRRASRLARGVTSGLPASHAPAAAIDPPAGRRRPGGFSPHYILSDPIWVGKW